MKRLSSAAAVVFAFAGAITLSAHQVGPGSAVLAADDSKVTLTGCVVKGRDGGYLLTNVVATTAAAAPATPVGTAGEVAATKARPSQVLYWLNDKDELEGHAGQSVRVNGEVQGELKEGELEIERKDNGMVEVKAKSGGKTVTAMFNGLPRSVTTGGAALQNKQLDIDFIVRRVDVKSVTRIQGSCR